MGPEAARWFARRTYPGERGAAALAARKDGRSVSVVIPALDEAATVGPIVEAVRRELVEGAGLVDEVVVMDPGSTDATVEVATAAGATVVEEADVLPGYGRVAGKGEALWKSLYVTRGDLLVFLDADLVGFDPAVVTGLLAPLLREPDVRFVKGSFDRPLADGGRLLPGGGRVTELVARPLLNLHWPQLAGVVQPLAGEYAGRRELLERLPFASGYGVEFGLLVDVLRVAGLDAIAQVELGRRVHRNQDDEALGRMAAVIWMTALDRLAREGRPGPRPPDGAPAATLTQFRRDTAGTLDPVTTAVQVGDRPPMARVAGYRARHAVPPTAPTALVEGVSQAGPRSGGP